MTRWASNGLYSGFCYFVWTFSLFADYWKLKQHKSAFLCSGGGVFLVLCSFTLPWSMSQFKRYSWVKRTSRSHFQSPVMCPHHHYLTDPAPSVSPPLPSSRLTHHPLFCPLPFTEVVSVSPPRPIIASSPLSIVVPGTSLPFALLKVINSLHWADLWVFRASVSSFTKSDYGFLLPHCPHGFACRANEITAVKFPPKNTWGLNALLF